MMVPKGALDLGCRNCRPREDLYCACCPVVLRLVERGCLGKADRLMAAAGCAAALRDLEAT